MQRLERSCDTMLYKETDDAVLEEGRDGVSFSSPDPVAASWGSVIKTASPYEVVISQGEVLSSKLESLTGERRQADDGLTAGAGVGLLNFSKRLQL